MDTRRILAFTLAIEDEQSIVDILSFNLTKEGYDTLEALDGPTGGHQLPVFKGLGDVVVGSQLQTQHLVVLLLPGGEHNDWPFWACERKKEEVERWERPS
mgnify:CR=1 FL=1